MKVRNEVLEHESGSKNINIYWQVPVVQQKV